MRGKNAGNPDGLPSILTKQKRKSATENRGSDYIVSAKKGIMIKKFILHYEKRKGRNDNEPDTTMGRKFSGS